ncbi:MAG: hypothetical protein HW413_2758, partial [Thermoleophilia bacterium]|nr:hypothetical protein [Thermoleophilia bacterium]
TRDELENLREFRGRASHAESRDGTDELRRVRTTVAESEHRLKSLVERVITTKKDWGSRSAAVEDIVSLRALGRTRRN